MKRIMALSYLSLLIKRSTVFLVILALVLPHTMVSAQSTDPFVIEAQAAQRTINTGATRDLNVQNITNTLRNTAGTTIGQTINQAGSQLQAGLTNAINQNLPQTGNPIADGAIQGAAGAVSGALSCAVGGLISNAGTGIAAAAGLTVPVKDFAVGQNTAEQKFKDCTLDGIAFALKEGIIKGILRGMVTFINNGFSGGPAFLQNEDTYFQNLSDKQFEEFANNPQNFSALCSAWESDVRLALATRYSTSVGGQRVTQVSGTGQGQGQVNHYPVVTLNHAHSTTKVMGQTAAETIGLIS